MLDLLPSSSLTACFALISSQCFVDMLSPRIALPRVVPISQLVSITHFEKKAYGPLDFALIVKNLVRGPQRLVAVTIGGQWFRPTWLLANSDFQVPSRPERRGSGPAWTSRACNISGTGLHGRPGPVPARLGPRPGLGSCEPK